ncbi:glycosyltransferase family 2 protein [Sphingobacterium siyangense]|uniref:glycosyltransferase family 2 protein n=1 Tax=Sphingobacterium siyangense TaxID=459529 RepID=UPI003DA44B0D
MSSLSVIVLTYNEELHLERCLKSLQRVGAAVFIVDSFSTDRTREIAVKYGAEFYQNVWTNHATQINWAIDNCSITTDWVMRVDADEYLDDQLIDQINCNLDRIGTADAGIRIKRLMYFMDKPLKRGGMYPIWHLKIWRVGQARCEQRWMDERMVLSSGGTVELEGNLIDHNLNNLTWWTAKHNNYATREAIDVLDKLYGFTQAPAMSGNIWGNSETRRRWLKQKYLRMPLFLRPYLFFLIRYFVQLGFIEGRRGFVWSVLQCFWYRYLVDAKIEEAYRMGGKDKEALVKYFLREYGINITKI